MGLCAGAGGCEESEAWTNSWSMEQAIVGQDCTEANSSRL
jgi:hypothetical protein